MTAEFWKSAGQHLLGRSPEGWLTVTPAFIRAYWVRPEVEPIDTSCPNEIAAHEALLADPLRPVSDAALDSFADPDAANNYRAVLAFRDVLVAAGTIEGAYLRLIRADDIIIPPVFIDQLVHLIVRNILTGSTDCLELRAGEVLFRDQTVTRSTDAVLLTDDEVVAMQARAGDVGAAQLLPDPEALTREVNLTVLTPANAGLYWDRSDQFDMMLDFGLGQPAQTALARVMEKWLKHMLGIDATIEPRAKLDDQDWRWHIGLDAGATRILNTLYEGTTPPPETMARIIGLFRMTLADDTPVQPRVRGRPIYLGLAVSAKGHLKMKPQNLLMNLPLTVAS
jgi:Family of unknown function (DUF6352)